MPITRFHALTLRAAVLTLVLVVLTALALVWAETSYRPPPGAGGERHGDSATYERIIARMKAGEAYYPAAHAELVANDYGTRSVFNWRTPLYPTLVSLLPSIGFAQVLLAGLALAAALMAGRLAIGEGGLPVAMALGASLVVSLATCLAPATVLFSETAAGVLILMSVAARGLRWHWLAFAAAVLALFIRELAAPFVVVSALAALAARRKSEVYAWGAALCAYAGYFLLHAHEVAAQIGPMDKAYPDGWVQFGGLDFVLATAQVNGMFWLLPLWVTAIALPLSVLGLAAIPGRWSRVALATILAYLGLFLVVGKPVNTYWGLIYTPLLALGLAWAPFALRDIATVLLRPARGAWAR